MITYGRSVYVGVFEGNFLKFEDICCRIAKNINNVLQLYFYFSNKKTEMSFNKNDVGGLKDDLAFGFNL